MLLAAAPAGPLVGTSRKKTSAGPDGARTVQLPSPGNPLCALRLYFQVGSADDPPGKAGTAALTAAMLGEGGTKARTWAQIIDALYPMAAHIRSYGDRDGFVFEGTIHRDNLDAYADLLAQQVVTPRFDPADFARHKRNAIDHLEKTLRGNDDEDLGKEALATVLYRKHPYGRPAAGTVAGLAAVTLDDVRAFHAGHFTQDRLVVGVAGGVPDAFAATFAARFATLPATGKPRAKLPPAPARKGLDVLFIEKDAAANAISLGHPLSITRADADFYPLAVAASYLGEHRTFNGVLMNVMRQQRGLNYGDYAYIENFIQEGWSTFPLANIGRRQQHFEIWIRPVAPHNTLFALRHALYETDKLWREGIPESGFRETREFLASYCNLWTQDSSRRLGYTIDALVAGKDIAAELKARLPAMTKADVDRAVRKHLSPKNLAVAIVTDKAQALADKLLSGQPTPIVYDTKDTPADVLAEDKLIEKFPLPVSKSRVRVVTVDKMFVG